MRPEPSEATTAPPVRRGPGRPRKDQPDPQRFREILDGAASVFLARGYDAATIQEIAEGVGMLKGSLYHYVRTKEDFLYQILKQTFAAALTTMRAALAEQQDSAAMVRLATFVRTHIEFTVANFTAVSIQFRELRSLSTDRRAEITADGDEYAALLREVLEQGVTQDEFGDDIDIRLAIWSILGQLNAITQWYRPDGRLPVADIVPAFTGMIASSLVADRTTAEAGGVVALREQVSRAGA